MKNSPFPRLTAVLLALSLVLPAGAPLSAATEGGAGTPPTRPLRQPVFPSVFLKV